MMNFWYDQDATIQSLQQLGALEGVLQYILQTIPGMQKDFEVKRLVLGLSSLICQPN